MQSAESSNRIEGVTIDPERLRPLVLGQARPCDRSEREIFGYRHALNLIHANAESLSIDPGALATSAETLRAHEAVGKEVITSKRGQERG